MKGSWIARSSIASALLSVLVSSAALAGDEERKTAHCDVSTPGFNIAYKPLRYSDTETSTVVYVRCHGNGGPLTVDVYFGDTDPSGHMMRRRGGGGVNGVIRYSVSHDGQPFGGTGRNGAWHYHRHFDRLDGTDQSSFLLQIVARARQDVLVGTYSESVPLVTTTF